MKVLVVVDMQNDFVDGALGTKEAEAIVPAVVRKIESFDGKVIYTRDTHHENYLETLEGHNLPVVHCVEGTEGWELNPEIERLRKVAGDAALTIDKPTFGSSELGAALLRLDLDARRDDGDGKGIEEITLIGLCTDICVISNALLVKAFLPEVPIKVDAACCAGVTPENHDNALLAMKCCQIEVIQ